MTFEIERTTVAYCPSCKITRRVARDLKDPRAARGCRTSSRNLRRKGCSLTSRLRCWGTTHIRLKVKKAALDRLEESQKKGRRSRSLVQFCEIRVSWPRRYPRR